MEYIIPCQNMKTCPLPDCHRTLTSSYKLKMHMERFHLNIKNFQCPHCLKALKSRDSLNRHGFMHRDSTNSVDFALTGARAMPVDRAATPIPRLSLMVKYAQDPDLRPLVHILKMYPFPHDQSMQILPPITRKP